MNLEKNEVPFFRHVQYFRQGNPERSFFCFFPHFLKRITNQGGKARSCRGGPWVTKEGRWTKVLESFVHYEFTVIVSYKPTSIFHNEPRQPGGSRFFHSHRYYKQINPFWTIFVTRHTPLLLKISNKTVKRKKEFFRKRAHF